MPRKKRTTTQLTKEEKVLALLEDRKWHSTRELRRIAHYFSAIKWKLVHQNGYDIERRLHPSKKYQHQYRLVDTPITMEDIPF